MVLLVLRALTFSMDGMVFRTADEAYLEVSVVEGRGLEIVVTYARPQPVFQ